MEVFWFFFFFFLWTVAVWEEETEITFWILKVRFYKADVFFCFCCSCINSLGKAEHMKDFSLSHIFIWSVRKPWVKDYYVMVRKVKIQNMVFILLWLCSFVALLIATLCVRLSHWLLISQLLPAFFFDRQGQQGLKNASPYKRELKWKNLGQKEEKSFTYFLFDTIFQ